MTDIELALRLLRDGVAYVKDGKIISADDVYLDTHSAKIETQAAERERQEHLNSIRRSK